MLRLKFVAFYNVPLRSLAERTIFHDPLHGRESIARRRRAASGFSTGHA